MVWSRASAPEYDAWVPFTSADWSFTGLLPFFERSETISNVSNPFPGIRDADRRAPDEYAGHDGPVQVSRCLA